MRDNEITGKIIECAFAVHNALGSGFLEKVYENALMLKIRKVRLEALQQFPLRVFYENELVGEFFADLLVAQRIVVEDARSIIALVLSCMGKPPFLIL